MVGPLAATATDPEDGEITLTDSNFSVETEYDGKSAGNYSVTLTVLDTDGNAAKATMTLSVKASAPQSGTGETGSQTGAQRNGDVLATVLIWTGATAAMAVAVVVIVLIVKKKT